ncbi:MAG: hypothetical protein P1V97_00255 [Planctomycetota bacterium]|nr:hypothetical protein [Planctomycetota bacterium]
MNNWLAKTVGALLKETSPDQAPFILLQHPNDPIPENLETLSFEAPFSDFEALQKQSRVLFSGFTNVLDMVDFRKLCHRAAHILRQGGLFQYIARNPDDILDQYSPKPWPGEPIDVGAGSEIYRPLRQHFELLRLFGFRLKVPTILPRVAGQNPLLLFGAIKEEVAVTHLEAPKSEDLIQRCDEKYGPDSEYRRFNRLEEPEIVDDLLYAMRSMGLKDGDTVLGLGSNDGRELQLFERMGLKNLQFIGIDASETATAEARSVFNDPKHQFIAADLGALSQLKLKPVQGILLLNVLQCTTVNRDKLLSDLKALFAKRCAVLVSLPNNHFLSGDLARRPLSRKDPRHDRSLIMKDLRYLTRYFYRTPFKSIECFGSYDSFLLARR